MFTLPATTQRLSEIRKAQLDYEECRQTRANCTQSWPTYVPHQPLMRPYCEYRAHLTLTGDLLLYDERLVIPRSMRLEILDHLHTGHLGITMCQARTQTSVWWPGLSIHIENMVASVTPVPETALSLKSYSCPFLSQHVLEKG